ncbi:MAG TPA: HEAT repeat domain-containing protein [Gemmataceae bacterium]|nr:HEAT repeat domain-containing protein [Gemmataceae bacterium]
MSRSRYYWRVGFAALLLAVPACMAPGAAAPAAPAAAAAPAAPAGLAGAGGPFVSADPDLAPPQTGLEKCCKSLDDLRRKCCKTPFGQMINGMTLPLAGLTGGVIPQFCPIAPNAKDLAKPGVEGEAAAVKKDALEAKARREAVRLLGTVDCRYYADAEPKLIAALRTDGIECVRLEAAMAMGRGCCCTRKVIAALEMTVSGSEDDGNPAERSPRVRDAAAESLAHCLECNPPAPIEPEVLPEPDKDKERRKGTTETGTGTMDVQYPPSRKPDEALLRKARETLETYNANRPATPVKPANHEKSLYSLLKGSDGGPSLAPPAAKPPLPPAGPTVPTTTTEPPLAMPESIKTDVKPAANLNPPE